MCFSHQFIALIVCEMLRRNKKLNTLVACLLHPQKWIQPQVAKLGAFFMSSHQTMLMTKRFPQACA